MLPTILKLQLLSLKCLELTFLKAYVDKSKLSTFAEDCWILGCFMTRNDTEQLPATARPDCCTNTDYAFAAEDGRGGRSYLSGH